MNKAFFQTIQAMVKDGHMPLEGMRLIIASLVAAFFKEVGFSWNQTELVYMEKLSLVKSLRAYFPKEILASLRECIDVADSCRVHVDSHHRISHAEWREIIASFKEVDGISLDTLQTHFGWTVFFVNPQLLKERLTARLFEYFGVD